MGSRSHNLISEFRVLKCACPMVENSLLGQWSSVPRPVSMSSSVHVKVDKETNKRNKSHFTACTRLLSLFAMIGGLP